MTTRSPAGVWLRELDGEQTGCNRNNGMHESAREEGRRMSKTIADWQKEAWKTAESNGFHEKHEGISSILSMAVQIINFHEEVSEVWACVKTDQWKTTKTMLEGKPQGVAIELADIVLRVLDTCEMNGIDLDEAMHMKNEYNKTRPYMHGKEY
jgi:NTP pyrophosphatase (non-canonical NTP hydrolase)